MEVFEWMRIVWAAVAIAAALAAVYLALRARGIFSWRRALRAELDDLADRAADSDNVAAVAVDQVVQRCRSILESNSPDFGQLQDIPQYVRSIAACFHPEAERPELQVTIGACLTGLNHSLERFDRILSRTGFTRIRRMNLRQVRNLRAWYRQAAQSPLYRWAQRHRKWLGRFVRLRLLFYIDPFMWLAYLSNRLTAILLVKYLLVDIYLFVGNLALQIFSVPTGEAVIPEPESLEETLEALEHAEAAEAPSKDPQIQQIRQRLVGLSAMLGRTPTLVDWKNAVVDAAAVIAARHFPGSEAPLLEAAVGPLLQRGRVWIESLGRGEDYRLTRRLYRVRIDTLYRAKNITDLALPRLVRGFLKTAYNTYGWLRWPMRLYRWARKRTGLALALEIGWQAAKKATLAHLYGRSFDLACRELEMVYQDSRKLRGLPKPDDPPSESIGSLRGSDETGR